MDFHSRETSRGRYYRIPVMVPDNTTQQEATKAKSDLGSSAGVWFGLFVGVRVCSKE